MTDTPDKVNFASWDSFSDFWQEVASSRRYVYSLKARAFLSAVAHSCHSRALAIPKGRTFFRAQVAHGNYEDDESGAEYPIPAPHKRMIPLSDRAREGRVNPKGIPCLYMATDIHTAMAETRPWIGSYVSVATLRTIRPLKIVNCIAGIDQNWIPPDETDETTDKENEESAWSHIARAFRKPVTRDDDRADYAVTQIIAETFREQSFDGIGYRSSFGKDKFNIALFDLDATESSLISLYEIKDVKFDFREIAPPR